MSGWTFREAQAYFEVDDNDDGGQDLMGFYSADNGNAARLSQLVITYLP